MSLRIVRFEAKTCQLLPMLHGTQRGSSNFIVYHAETLLSIRVHSNEPTDPRKELIRDDSTWPSITLPVDIFFCDDFSFGPSAKKRNNRFPYERTSLPSDNLPFRFVLFDWNENITSSDKCSFVSISAIVLHLWPLFLISRHRMVDLDRN